MLFKSTNPEDVDFVPGFVLMGPSINTQGVVPDYVEVPLGANTTVVEGMQSFQATYEPFSPSTFYSLADLDLEAPSSDTYYVAVYEPSGGGRYGLAVGDRETYTLAEWILLPFSLILVYRWEGQSLALVFAPLIITLVIGVGLMIWTRKSRRAPTTLFGWFGSLAGLFFIGSGATTLLQTVISIMQASLVPEIVITLMLASIPILLGIGTLYLSLRAEGKASPRVRISLAILGLVALFAWAGLFIGPALAIVASVLPSRFTTFKP